MFFFLSNSAILCINKHKSFLSSSHQRKSNTKENWQYIAWQPAINLFQAFCIHHCICHLSLVIYELKQGKWWFRNSLCLSPPRTKHHRRFMIHSFFRTLYCTLQLLALLRLALALSLSLFVFSMVWPFVTHRNALRNARYCFWLYFALNEKWCMFSLFSVSCQIFLFLSSAYR